MDPKMEIRFAGGKKVYADYQAPEFPEKYTSALIKSMNLCYVKKHFQQPPEFEFDVS